MADAPIAVRGSVAFLCPKSGSNGTRYATATSHADTAVGDYLLCVASVDYRAGLGVSGDSGVESLTGAAQQFTVVTSTYDDTDVEICLITLARVTEGGPRTVTADQGSGSSGLHGHLYTLNPGGGTITVDGAVSNLVDRSTPYTFPSLTPVGAQDLLVIAHGAIQFSGTIAYGSAPSPMVGLANYFNQYSGLQSAYQQLTSAAPTGTRDLTSNIATLSGGAAGIALLRNDVPAAGGGPEPGRHLISGV